MRLFCDPLSAGDLKSSAQRVRRISEQWFQAEGYCLRCQSRELRGTKSSTEFCDAFCPICGIGYELKSKRGAFTNVIADGGYEAMLRNIASASAPILMLMNYERNWSVQKLEAVHPVFFTPSMVVRRKSPHIRPNSGKPYWMCNLDLSGVPLAGRILLIQQGVERRAEDVRNDFASVSQLQALPFKARGWAGAVLSAIRLLPNKSFKTADLYAYTSAFRRSYPTNRNIEAKIRQQLQILERLGYVERTSRGIYQLQADASRDFISSWISGKYSA